VAWGGRSDVINAPAVDRWARVQSKPSNPGLLQSQQLCFGRAGPQPQFLCLPRGDSAGGGDSKLGACSQVKVRHILCEKHSKVRLRPSTWPTAAPIVVLVTASLAASALGRRMRRATQSHGRHYMPSLSVSVATTAALCISCTKPAHW
jgi:hypothetical protein